MLSRCRENPRPAAGRPDSASGLLTPLRRASPGIAVVDQGAPAVVDKESV
ncbi:hypothetical protein [Arthrobacter sp. NicSoilB4]|nr:hypothetical protein [Arthrobacter sp. NicSoilB4]